MLMEKAALSPPPCFQLASQPSIPAQVLSIAKKFEYLRMSI
jgi:hypothetical protein